MGGTDAIDTNSGTVSRLTPEWNGDGTLADLDHEVMVLGLPRSEENHATNGLELSSDGETLYVSQGGHTNKGAPSNNFGYLPEYALSAAVLEIDLAQIDSETDTESLQSVNGDYPDLEYRYALPTVQETELPFGGDDGLNQAKIVPGGPVQIYSPGYRNTYDLVLTEDEQLYVLDHDGNSGWGGLVVGEGPDGICTNEPNEDDSGESGDQLHYVTEGYYGGHPAPIRGNPEGAGLYDSDGNLYFEFDESNTPVPFDQANPIECEYQSPQDDGSIGDTFGPTGAIDEYTASNFGGEMQGDLLVVELFGPVNRVQLNAAGDDVTEQETFLNANGALGITAQGDDGVFPGTVWTANHGADDVTVFEPDDFDPDAVDPGDDEPDNGEEEEYDPADPFPLDDSDGLDTELPVTLDFEPNSHPGTVLDLGFTGLMANGEDPYVDLYDAGNVVAGGAANALTVEETTAGDATNNDQEYAFQLGVNAPDEPFTIHSEVTGYPEDPQDYQSMGVFLGNGDQDNYAKLVVSANGGTGGVEFAKETDGNFQSVAQPDDPDVTGPNVNTDLYLTVFPSNNTVKAHYTTGDDELTYVGETTIPQEWHDEADRGLAVGIISTSYQADSSFPATWRNLHITPEDETEPVLSADAGADQTVSEGEQVTLDATGSTGDDLTYSWMQTEGPSVSLSDADTATPTFTAPAVDEDQTLTFQVEVSDGIETETDVVNVTVVDTTVAEGDAIHRVNVGGPEISPTDDGPAWGADTDSVPSEYLVSGGAIPGGQPFDIGDIDTSVPDGTPDEIFQYDRYDPPEDPPMQWSFPTEEGETYEVRLYFHDAWDGTSEPGDRVFNVTIDDEYVLTDFDIVGKYGDNTAAMEAFTVESDGSIDVGFEHVNENPQINGFEIVAVDDEEDDEERTIKQAIAGLNEPENKIDLQSIQQAINWWATGEEVPETGGQTIDLSQMQQLINVWATDATVGEEDEPNQPPTIDSIDDQTVTEGESVDIGVSADDPDGDDLTLSVDGPEFVTLADAGDGTGTITISPESSDAGTYTVDVTADDGEATATESFQLTVEEAVSDPVAQTLYRINSGESSDVSAIDDGPDWIGVEDDASPYLVSVAEEDSGNYDGGDDVTPTDSVPESTPDAVFDAERYGEMQWEFPVDSGTETEVRLYLSNQFPGSSEPGDRQFNVSIDGTQVLTNYDPVADVGHANGVMKSFVVTSDGTIDIDFEQGEAENPQVNAIELVTVGEQDEPNQPPTIDAIDDQTVTEGETVEVSVSATDPDGDDLTLSVDGPEFVSLSDAGDGTGTLTVAPEDGDAGTYTVDVTADDGQDMATESFQLTVEEDTTDAVGETSLTITEGSNNIDASTFGSNSFQITNTGEKEIASVTLDLSTTVLPDMIYDPEGTAGDEIGKDFTPDSGGSQTGLIEGTLSEPHNGDPDDGYDVLTITFDDFQSGETFGFSIDNDPTSIKGSPGSQAAGPVSGLELTGASFTVEYADGSAQTDRVFGDGSVGGAEALASESVPDAPSIDAQNVDLEGTTLSDVHTAATVTETEQTIVVDAPAGETITLLQIEGELNLEDVPEWDGTPGYDIEEYEANNAVEVTYHEATVESGGTVEVPVSLTNSTDVGGYNYFVAATEDAEGNVGITSNVVILKHEEQADNGDVGSETVFAVNAGGSEHTASDGTVFQSDTDFDGGTTYSTSASIAETDDDPLYQTERYGDFSYDVPIDDGTYEVTLHFAEIYLGTDEDPDADEDRAGERVFDVSIEGEEALSAYDIYAAVGTLTATQETITTDVTDGELNIEFATIEDNAKISAIEVSEIEGGAQD